jgi:LytS/YehU family sensor histidine kinase
MALGMVIAHALLWAFVLFIRRWRPTATPGFVATLITCAMGGNFGAVLAELAKSAITKAPPELSPLLPVVIGGVWTGAIFFFLRRSIEYAARYRRIKRATQIAQGQVLANQLKPHFLFNSLNALSELIETDAQQGAEMAHRLAELFRRISSSASHATMPLAAELAIVREYLEIEKVRLADRLTYVIEEPTWSKERHIPTLMLQTLVENAVKHGIAPCVAGGSLRVSFHAREDGAYECVVLNTGQAYAPSALANGVGLENTRDRLRQLYGSDFTLSVTAEREGTKACFRFTGEVLAQNLGD